jgi:hypothetical protein
MSLPWPELITIFAMAVNIVASLQPDATSASPRVF